MSPAVVALETGWCTFTVADGLYGVPVSRMEEVLRPQTLTRVPLAPPAVAGLLNLRGRIVPAVDLRVLFGRERGTTHGGLIVLRGQDGPVALMVDEIGDFQRVPAHLLETGEAALGHGLRGDGDGLAAATIPLADRLLVVLDTERTLERAFARPGREPGVGSAHASRAGHPSKHDPATGPGGELR